MLLEELRWNGGLSQLMLPPCQYCPVTRKQIILQLDASMYFSLNLEQDKERCQVPLNQNTEVLVPLLFQHHIVYALVSMAIVFDVQTLENSLSDNAKQKHLSAFIK